MSILGHKIKVVVKNAKENEEKEFTVTQSYIFPQGEYVELKGNVYFIEKVIHVPHYIQPHPEENVRLIVIKE